MFARVKSWCDRTAGCLRTFPTFADYRTFRECEIAGPSAPAVPVHVRQVPIPLGCRPGTTDAAVLYDTFAGRYHLPAVPLGNAPTIVDLGANVGYTAVDFLVRYPSSRVIAVEMDPNNCQLARRNLEPFSPRVELVEAAFWGSDGTIHYGGTTAWGFRVDEGASDGQTARAVTLETLFATCNVARADYVKMDVEGAEARVIVPEARWLERVDAIQVECHPPATPERIMEVLRGFGFQCSWDRRGILGRRSAPMSPTVVDAAFACSGERTVGQS